MDADVSIFPLHVIPMGKHTKTGKFHYSRRRHRESISSRCIIGSQLIFGPKFDVSSMFMSEHCFPLTVTNYSIILNTVQWSDYWIFFKKILRKNNFDGKKCDSTKIMQTIWLGRCLGASICVWAQKKTEKNEKRHVDKALVFRRFGHVGGGRIYGRWHFVECGFSHLDVESPFGFDILASHLANATPVDIGLTDYVGSCSGSSLKPNFISTHKK